MESTTQIVSGNIITMDSARPRAESMVVRDGRIVFVGDRKDALQHGGPRAKEWHFTEGAVIPGLIDSHNHMLLTGLQLRLVNLSGCKSVSELLEKVRLYAERHPAAEWIVSGAGWHVDALAEKRYPTRAELDRVCPDRPVYLPRVGHAAVANSRALERAGIDGKTPDPDGGRIDRDEAGNLTGLLLEPPACNLVGRLVPPPNRDELLGALRDIQRAYHAVGLCGIVDPGLRPDEMSIYQDLWESRELTMRSVVMPLAQTSDDPDAVIANLQAWGVRTNFGDERLKLGGIKVFLDGGASLGTALMREPFPDEQCSCGIQVTSTAVFQRIAEFCARNRWSLGVHAVGGKAIDIALAVFDEADRHHSIRDLRFQLIHAYLWPTAANMETVRRLGVVVATQASMQYQFAPLLVRRFGVDPVGKATPIRSWLDAGVMVAGGSDSPVTPYPPLLGLWHATTRFVDQLGVPVGANEKITPEEALRLYTRNAAWLCFSEYERGALIPGFLGDWVALSVDPLADPPETLKDAQVLATSVGGEIVYRAERH